MKSIDKRLKKYGEKVKINDREFFAVIFPFNYKSRIYTEGDYTPVGYTDDATYQMVAPASADLRSLEVGSIVFCNSGEYIVYHSENFYLFGKCIYSFAYLKRRVI